GGGGCGAWSWKETAGASLMTAVPECGQTEGHRARRRARRIDPWWTEPPALLSLLSFSLLSWFFRHSCGSAVENEGGHGKNRHGSSGFMGPQVGGQARHNGRRWRCESDRGCGSRRRGA